MIWLISGSRHAPEREVKAILDTMKATHGKPTLLLHGNAAGPIRNEAMLRMAMDLAAVRQMTLLCIAMPGPESSGTVDMITRITDRLGTPNPPGPRMILEIHKVSR